jgi:hypothetical protein
MFINIFSVSKIASLLDFCLTSEIYQPVPIGSRRQPTYIEFIRDEKIILRHNMVIIT